MFAASVIATVLLGASALADPQETRSQADAEAPVLVIHGTEQQGARQKSPAARKPSATRSTSESGVIVDRPNPAGFLRETSRLAAQAEANEQRAAQQQSREKDRQLTETLRALEGIVIVPLPGVTPLTASRVSAPPARYAAPAA
jgi:hypothetical protein